MTNLMIFGRKPGFREVLRDAEGKDGAGADAATVAAAAAAAAQKATDDAATAAAAAAATKAAEEAAANLDPKALAAEKAALLREVMDKKAKLATADAATAAATAALAAYNGVDPKKVQDLLKKEAEAEAAAALAKGDFETLKTMMAAEHARDIAALQAQIATLTEKTTGSDKVIDGLTMGAAFANSKFILENLIVSPSKARTIYGAHFEMKDGKMVGYDKPAGETGRAMLVTATGEPMDFEVALERIVAADPDKKDMTKVKVIPGSTSKSTVANAADKSGDKPQLHGVSRISAGLAANSK